MNKLLAHFSPLSSSVVQLNYAFPSFPALILRKSSENALLCDHLILK